MKNIQPSSNQNGSSRRMPGWATWSIIFALSAPISWFVFVAGANTWPRPFWAPYEQSLLFVSMLIWLVSIITGIYAMVDAHIHRTEKIKAGVIAIIIDVVSAALIFSFYNLFSHG